MTVDQLILVGREWGVGAVLAAVAFYAFWRLVWHIVKETVPREMYDKCNTERAADLADAVKANTSSIEMLSLKLDERVPRKGS